MFEIFQRIFRGQCRQSNFNTTKSEFIPSTKAITKSIVSTAKGIPKEGYGTNFVTRLDGEYP